MVENEKSLLTSKMSMKNMVMTLHFKSDTSNWKNWYSIALYKIFSLQETIQETCGRIVIIKKKYLTLPYWKEQIARTNQKN